MKDFDDELVADRERTFKLGGELFEWVYPHWEVGAQIFDETLVPAATNGDEPAFSFKQDTEFAIQRIPLFLNPKNESVKRFKALVARKTDAVPRHQFVQVYQYLVQVTSGLPTSPPSESGSGDGGTDTSSSAGSSSREETSTA